LLNGFFLPVRCTYFYAGEFHKVVKIKALARGAKASGGRGVSEWQRFYII
jgi:hypothetical protein